MSDMDTKSVRRRNKRWPETLKREIVAASFAPGASVSVVARQYDVNANQVFSWRRLYPMAASPSVPPAPSLVRVTIIPEPEDNHSAPSAPTFAEAIEIEVGGTYRIRVTSSFDSGALARILDVLDRTSIAQGRRR